MRKKPVRPARFLRTQHIIAVLIPALIVVLTITGFVWAQKGVTVVVDGESLFLKTQADDVEGLLAQADIEIHKGDLVSPGLDVEVTDGMSVVVRHAVNVTLILGGETIELPVVGSTVADALIA
ncbi:MAG: ubiquitin-like domain-containing protein, partial [Coriobacteriia bacterium]|nr:ubiquitin-like domain-containing protein [Coriobacteriia bacterium]